MTSNKPVAFDPLAPSVGERQRAVVEGRTENTGGASTPRLLRRRYARHERWFRITLPGLAALLLALPSPAKATDVGEEVEVTAGVVTGLGCALQARAKGDLKVLTACPPAEGLKELVVYDVAERQIYRIAAKVVRRYQLEGAFGGGSIDFTGTAVKVDAKAEIATVEVAEFSIAKKPKPGAFKGCL
jgi:hypothetical protein